MALVGWILSFICLFAGLALRQDMPIGGSVAISNILVVFALLACPMVWRELPLGVSRGQRIGRVGRGRLLLQGKDSRDHFGHLSLVGTAVANNRGLHLAGRVEVHVDVAERVDAHRPTCSRMSRHAAGRSTSTSTPATTMPTRLIATTGAPPIA